jgi:hypothetical protein
MPSPVRPFDVVPAEVIAAAKLIFSLFQRAESLQPVPTHRPRFLDLAINGMASSPRIDTRLQPWSVALGPGPASGLCNEISDPPSGPQS